MADATKASALIGAEVDEASLHEIEKNIAARGVSNSAGRFPHSDFIMRFVPSEDFMVSCGCVPVDTATRKVAILFDPNTGITQLPKGRKNIGEDFHAAAIRETFEEVGLPFEPLPLNVATRATPTSEIAQSLSNGADKCTTGVTRSVLSCEPSSVCYFRCSDTFALRLVFWYAARGDSKATPATGTKETWEEQYLLEWVDAADAAKRMTMAGDAQVVNKVLADMRLSGYDMLV